MRLVQKLSNYRYLPPDQYDALYWKLREKNDRSPLGKLSLRTRQRLHPALLISGSNILMTASRSGRASAVSILRGWYIVPKESLLRRRLLLLWSS